MGNQNNKKKIKEQPKTEIIENKIKNAPKTNYKIIFVGDSGIGAKSILINKIMGIELCYLSPNSSSYFTKSIDIGNNKIIKKFI